MCKKLFILFSLISIVFLASNVSAGFIGTDYVYVRSDSFTNFSPYQYSNYYDNIDFRFSLYTSGFNTTLPVVVTPRIYGYTPLGNRVYITTVPSSVFYIPPYSSYVYTYNNLFYFDSDYQSYEIELDAKTQDGSYTTTEKAYVYYEGTYVSGEQGNQDPENPYEIDCSKFNISGQTEIYLGEDDDYVYDLYLINTINEPLNITSITTNNPSDLDIDNINYPFILDGAMTRSAQIDLVSDTVSSDYSSSFDIYVTANYGNNLTCEKTYIVNYNIEDEDNESNANCDDLKINNDSFVIQENDSFQFEIILENNSFDYEYDIDEIDIGDTDFLDIQISSYPRNINEDDSKEISFNVYSSEIDNDQTEKLELEIKGYMTREGREDKKCTIKENIPIKVIDSDYPGISSPNCSKIELYTKSITQEESSNFNYSDGFYIYNTSNNKFTITDFSIKDNSTQAKINEKTHPSVLYASSKSSIDFILDTYDISHSEKINGEVSISGYFDDGSICSHSAITKPFEINIIDSEDVCSMVGVDNSTVQEGINNIRLFNNTNKNFTVNETLFQNKKNITVNSVDDIKVIPANSFTDFKIGVSNKEGSLEMLLKGVFDDGQECGFTETTKGVLKTSNYTSYFSDIDNCEFNIEFPKTVEFTNDSKYINLALQTNTPSSGILRIVSSDGIISDPITYLDGYDNINKSLLISNLTTNASVDYKVKIYGCEEKIYTTQLIKSEDNNFSEEGSLEIISFPSKLVSLDNYISSSVNILNNSFSNKDIKIQLTDFPNDWNIMLSDNPIEQNSKEIYVVSKNSNKTIYLKIYIPKNYDSNSYEGQLNIYSNDNLIFSNKLTVDKSKSDNDLLSLRMLYDIKKKLDGSYLVDINVFNDSDINKSAEIELYIDGNKVSIDSNNIFIEANNKTNQKINILENNNIENSLVTIKLIDKTNGNILLEESKDIKTKDKGIITALFSFSDTKGIIQSVVLIILIVSLILYIIYSNKKTKIKKIENIKNKEGNTKKITDY